LEWTSFIVNHEEFKSNPSFVERNMSIISRNFGNLNKASQASLYTILTKTKCIVTKTGLNFPGESYFKTVDLFADLPIISFENVKSVSDTFLKFLGVRDHVDLQTIFTRLQDLEWDSNYVELVAFIFEIY
jgi:hypothetical protein